MTIAAPIIDLHVDIELLEHRAHLPETISCHCGYRRPTFQGAHASRTLAE